MPSQKPCVLYNGRADRQCRHRQHHPSSAPTGRALCPSLYCQHPPAHTHKRTHTHTHLHALLLQILDVRLPFDELALLNSYLPYLKRALNMDSLAVRVVDPTAYF